MPGPPNACLPGGRESAQPREAAEKRTNASSNHFINRRSLPLTPVTEHGETLFVGHNSPNSAIIGDRLE